MGELSGKRVVGERTAPELRVMYQCGECGHIGVLDAYDGPPSCLGKVLTKDQHSAAFMVPLRIVKGEVNG